MFTSATAETSYPTGQPLGLLGQADAAAGDVIGAADTRTTTQTSSYFHQANFDQGRMRNAFIRSIEVVVIGVTGPTFKLQDQTGQKDLTPTFVGDAVKRIEFGVGGLMVNGGFRVVTAGTTAPICAIVYDVFDG